jgi:ribosomal protein S18 acetylase RimI-like enzyme
MIEICLLDQRYKQTVKEIFFLSSSRKTFDSDEKKAHFYKRWCEDYMNYYPDQFYIMKESETDKVLGYLSGCDNSVNSLEQLDVPGHMDFKDLFELYPAHFHINFHPDCRGRGLGGQLIEYYCRELSSRNISGVHLITSPDAANVSFYRRLKFSYEETRVLGKFLQLFMGQKLC